MKKVIKAVIRPIKKLKRFFYEKIIIASWKEKNKRYGRLNPDKKFYVIRQKTTASSWGPIFLRLATQLEVCEEQGRIPVIDFSFYENIYCNKRDSRLLGGGYNFWETYFCQPTKHNLSEVYHSKDVVLGDASIGFSNSGMDGVDYINAFIDNKDGLRDRLQMLFNRYVVFRNDVAAELESLKDEIFGGKGRILGVAYRGSDYLNRRVTGENRQPKLKQICSDIEKALDEWNCDYIYLTTEDEEVFAKFKERFGDKIISEQRHRYPGGTVGTPWYCLTENDVEIKATEYLRTIWLLSQCDCLLSGRFGMIYPTLLFNNNSYSQVKLYDLGIYTEQDYINSKNGSIVEEYLSL